MEVRDIRQEDGLRYRRRRNEAAPARENGDAILMSIYSPMQVEILPR